jgi:hypothetical protein
VIPRAAVGLHGTVGRAGCVDLAVKAGSWDGLGVPDVTPRYVCTKSFGVFQLACSALVPQAFLCSLGQVVNRDVLAQCTSSVKPKRAGLPPTRQHVAINLWLTVELVQSRSIDELSARSQTAARAVAAAVVVLVDVEVVVVVAVVVEVMVVFVVVVVVVVVLVLVLVLALVMVVVMVVVVVMVRPRNMRKSGRSLRDMTACAASITAV